jgi:hypothetical protein
MPEPAPAASLAELQALSEHAADRVALYRRRLYIGQGDPKRLAELERIAQGAAERLRIARAAA